MLSDKGMTFYAIPHFIKLIKPGEVRICHSIYTEKIDGLIMLLISLIA